MKCRGAYARYTWQHPPHEMNKVAEENGIAVYQCPVCGRFHVDFDAADSNVLHEETPTKTA